MNNKLRYGFQFYPHIVGHTYTNLPSYISIVKNVVNQHNDRTKLSYDIFNHISTHSQITQIYKNLHKSK